MIFLLLVHIGMLRGGLIHNQHYTETKQCTEFRNQRVLVHEASEGTTEGVEGFIEPISYLEYQTQ